MLVRYLDVPAMVQGIKTGTGRHPAFKINAEKEHKFNANLRHPAFMNSYIESAEVMQINQVTRNEWNRLNYKNSKEYLAEPFNAGLTAESEKKFIFFKPLEIYWNIVEKYNIPNLRRI